jgi:hypothetical protein
MPQATFRCTISIAVEIIRRGLDAGDRAQLPDNLRHYCRN